jgi:hypothetical protein
MDHFALPLKRSAFIHFNGKICELEILDWLAHTFLFMGARLTGGLFPIDWEMDTPHLATL